MRPYVDSLPLVIKIGAFSNLLKVLRRVLSRPKSIVMRPILSPLFHKYSDVYFIGAIAPLWARLVSLEGAALPRSSPFVIRLSRGERQELQARTRKYTSPYRDVIRAKIVLLAAAGLSNDVIASRLDTPRQIV